MILLTERVPDTYSGDSDGCTSENRGVFSSAEEMIKALLGKDHASAVVKHVEPKGFNGGEISIRFDYGLGFPRQEIRKFEYEIIELDKLI